MCLKAVFLALVFCADMRPLSSGGVENERILGRIYQGEIVSIEKFPWMAEISHNGSPVCGGSILNKRTILTAAHCLTYTTEKYQVRVGTNIKHKGGQLIDVKELSLHHGYSNTTQDNDIGLIRLGNDIAFPEKVAPIGLPKFGQEVKEGTVGYVAGYGATGNGTSSFLRFTHAEVIGQKTCRDMFKGYTYTDRMMCARNLKRKIPACPGDSGAPLVANKVAIGIMSWVKSEHACQRGFNATVFTRVSSFVDWIEETMTKWNMNCNK